MLPEYSIAQGQSNAEIAAHLALSPNTVRNYVSNIFSKLQVADLAEFWLLPASPPRAGVLVHRAAGYANR